jgi:hypothetical protein
VSRVRDQRPRSPVLGRVPDAQNADLVRLHGVDDHIGADGRELSGARLPTWAAAVREAGQRVPRGAQRAGDSARRGGVERRQVIVMRLDIGEHGSGSADPHRGFGAGLRTPRAKSSSHAATTS